MKQKDGNLGNKQTLSRGQEMHKMVFGEPDEKPLIGVREFTTKRVEAHKGMHRKAPARIQ